MISTSIRRLTTLFVVMFILLSAGLVYWQVIVAQQVASNSHNPRKCLSDSAPIRGRILDRNGVVLAESLQSDTGCGFLRHYYEPSLAGLIGYYINPDFPSTGLEHAYDDYLSGRKGATSFNNTVNSVLHRPPVGSDIYLTIDVRIQRLANQLFDEQVPANPDNVYPTDRGSMVVMDPHTGEVLAMVSRPSFDPNRVASLDMVNYAKGDPHRWDPKDTYINALIKDDQQNFIDDPLIERPIQGLYVPGSTFKTLTLIAGLDSGKSTLDGDLFDKTQAEGPLFYNGQEVKGNNICCYTYRFPVSLRYGFSHSDNLIFAQEGVKEGLNTWLDYNKRFYVGQQIPFDLPTAVSDVTGNGQLQKMSAQAQEQQIAFNAFGQGFDSVSPLQMSMFDNAIAANGQLWKPWLVSRIVNPDPKTVNAYRSGPPPNLPPTNAQDVLQQFVPQLLGTPISATTASAAREAMKGVVWCGSGSFIVDKMRLSPYSIIAKTGTGEVGGGRPANAWLLTQAPFDNPRLTIVALKENGGEGGFSDGPMVTDLYNAIFSDIMKIAPTPSSDDAQNTYCFDTTGLLQHPSPTKTK